MNDLGAALAHLDYSWLRVRQYWEAAAAWPDDGDRHPGREPWLPLERQMQATQREMVHLIVVLAQVQRAMQ